MAKQKILVTGAKGQLGKKIVDLMSDDFDLILTDYDTMDITDFNQVMKIFKAKKPNYVIHAAAYTQVDKAEDNPEICRKVNTEGTKNIALACQEFNIPLIYISTDYVFDGKKDSPYAETDSTGPLSIYGQTKLQGEKEIENVFEKYYIIRGSWIFGELPEGHPGTNFVETMIRLSRDRDELNIVNDQVGSPTYTGDLVEIIIRLIKQNPKYGIYHFSGQGACSWYDFAKEIFNQLNLTIKLAPITSDQFPQKAKRPAYSYMDKSKIEKALGINVRPWQEMLRDYLDR